MLGGLVVRVRLHGTLLLRENKLQFAKDLRLGYGGCIRRATPGLIRTFMRGTLGSSARGTYSVVASAATPDVLLDGELRHYTEKLPVVRSAVTPGQEHLLHLTASRGIDGLVRLDEEVGDDGTEVACIGIVDILGDGV